MKKHLFLVAGLVIFFMFIGNMLMALVSKKESPFEKALEHFFFEVVGVLATCTGIYITD